MPGAIYLQNGNLNQKRQGQNRIHKWVAPSCLPKSFVNYDKADMPWTEFFQANLMSEYKAKYTIGINTWQGVQKDNFQLYEVVK